MRGTFEGWKYAQAKKWARLKWAALFLGEFQACVAGMCIATHQWWLVASNVCLVAWSFFQAIVCAKHQRTFTRTE
jgi:hypothetical protein